MLLNYSKIIGLPVADLQNENNIGSIKEILFNSECAVVGFMLRSAFLSLSDDRKIIPSDIVVSLSKDGLTIRKGEDIAEMSEMVRLKGIVSHRLFGVNQKVATAGGEQVGTVYDYLIESTTLAIVKFYVRHLWQEKIIPVSQIVGFETNKIIIKDNSNTVPASDPAPESASSLIE